MRSSSRYAVVAIATSMTAGLLAGPSAAYAAGTVTTLTAAQMAAALQHVATASTATAKMGWKETETATIGRSSSLSASFVVDPVGGVMFEKIRLGSLTVVEYAVEHKGTYTEVTDPLSRQVLAMMHRPHVRYAFTPDRTLSLTQHTTDMGLSPAGVLHDDVRHAGTKTLHPDGSAEYRFKAQTGEALTIYVTSAGSLYRAKVQGKDGKAVLTFAYGAQHPGTPPSSGIISMTELARGISYLGMADNVRSAADDSAYQARRAAHGHTVTVTAVRKAARRSAAALNTALSVRIIKVTNSHGGATVSATNPWTHQSVAYTVTASGKKAVVHKK